MSAMGDALIRYAHAVGLDPADPATAERAQSYLQDAADLLAGLEFEFCAECGGDAADHTISPDPLGKPHPFCHELREEPTDPERCPWQTGYGLPWMTFCGRRKSAEDRWCTEHEQMHADLYGARL